MTTATAPNRSQSLWAELRLNIPGFIGHQARVALAKAESDAIPRAFFNYPDEQGGPALNAPPLIRILANGYRIRVLGLTAEGALMLYTHAADVARAFSKNTGAPVWHLREGSFRAHRSAPCAYRCDAFVITLPVAERESARLGRFDNSALLAVVTTQLRYALARQTKFLGLSVDVATIANVSISRSVAVSVKADRYLTALNITFTVDADLGGPWQLGKLQARGYGRLQKNETGCHARLESIAPAQLKDETVCPAHVESIASAQREAVAV